MVGQPHCTGPGFSEASRAARAVASTADTHGPQTRPLSATSSASSKASGIRQSAHHILAGHGGFAGTGASAPVTPGPTRRALSAMMSTHTCTHSSQIKTVGPAMSFLTSRSLLLQKEQRRAGFPAPSCCSVRFLPNTAYSRAAQHRDSLRREIDDYRARGARTSTLFVRFIAFGSGSSQLGLNRYLLELHQQCAAGREEHLMSKEPGAGVPKLVVSPVAEAKAAPRTRWEEVGISAVLN
jgi:hypothetical protein